VKPRLRPIDAFVAVNSGLFLLLLVFRYHERFVHFRGPGHLEEFFVYASVILFGIAALWHTFRDHPFDPRLLGLLQLGIVMHFAGAFVLFPDGRLYDQHLLGIRYDKFVHFVNAAAIAALLDRLFRILHIPRGPLTRILLLMTVLGLGAIIEMVEYVVVLTIPTNGVGDYDNNMQDLIANVCGGAAYLLATARRPAAPPPA
jgi:uncharacterized membrane protein YjdF